MEEVSWRENLSTPKGLAWTHKNSGRMNTDIWPSQNPWLSESALKTKMFPFVCLGLTWSIS